MELMLETAILDAARLDPVQRELLAVTDRLLTAIMTGDTETYASLCTPDLSCFEDVCAHRIDGVTFHLHLLERTAARRGAQAERCDILSPRVQVYGDAAIVTYTRLLTYGNDDGARWETFNETRVFVRTESGWKMAHFHRSPA
jgi:ketosteroid isomerase-like protein